MYFSQRVLWFDGSTIVDVSKELDKSYEGTKVIAYTSGKYLYVGSDLPFNHKYIEVKAPNSASASVSVEIWYSHMWVPAVDIIDETETSGATLARSGIIQWSPNRLKGWDREQDSDDVAGLTGTVIYNMYWARFSFSATLTETTELSYIGNRFADDARLFRQYPGLNNTSLMEAYGSGKTDWNDQHHAAAEAIVSELKRRDIIQSRAQILDSSLFTEAGIHKAAQIIYGGLGGEAYMAQSKEAGKLFSDAMNIKKFSADIDNDGRLSDYERSVSTRYMTR